MSLTNIAYRGDFEDSTSINILPKKPRMNTIVTVLLRI